MIYPLFRKAQDLALVPDQGADQDLKTDLVPGLVHDHTTAALNQHRAPSHDLAHHDAIDRIPSHPSIQDPGLSPVQSHDLDQNQSPGLDHALTLHNHQKMKKLAQNLKQTRIRITIQQMVMLKHSKLNSLLRVTNF